MNRKIDILQHEIEFYIQDDEGVNIKNELPEYDIEHIEEMIKDGYHTGEICASIFLNETDDEPTECHGWWSIVGKGLKVGEF